MQFRKVNEEFAVSGQIGAAQVPEIAAAGYRSLVCNRPDTEDGAVAHDEIEAAALAAGLEFRFIPVVSGAITGKDVADMAEAMDSLPKPVFAYCRSGARCLNLYGLVRQND